MTSTNEQVAQDFFKNFPDKPGARVGDKVVFLMVENDSILRYQGTLWQTRSDGAGTILVGNLFKTTTMTYVRKAQTDS